MNRIFKKTGWLAVTGFAFVACGALAVEPNKDETCPTQLIEQIGKAGATALLEGDPGLKRKPRQHRFQTEWERFLAELAESGDPLETQILRMRHFGRVLAASLPEPNQSEIRKTLEALRFIDYGDAALFLLKAFRTGDDQTLLDQKIWARYDSGDGLPNNFVGPSPRNALKDSTPCGRKVDFLRQPRSWIGMWSKQACTTGI